MRVLLPLLGLLAALNASALSFTYSGTVSSSTAQRLTPITGEVIPGYFINAGDTFTVTYSAGGYPFNDPRFADPNVRFSIQIGDVSIVSSAFQWTGNYTGTEEDFSANSLQEAWAPFRCIAEANVTETGGRITLGFSRELLGAYATGSAEFFFGDQAQLSPAQDIASVPDAASALGLLGIGCAAIFGLRLHRKLTPPRA